MKEIWLTWQTWPEYQLQCYRLRENSTLSALTRRPGHCEKFCVLDRHQSSSSSDSLSCERHTIERELIKRYKFELHFTDNHHHHHHDYYSLLVRNVSNFIEIPAREMIHTLCCGFWALVAMTLWSKSCMPRCKFISYSLTQKVVMVHLSMWLCALSVLSHKQSHESAMCIWFNPSIMCHYEWNHKSGSCAFILTIIRFFLFFLFIFWHSVVLFIF
jgi:hypothetical protein